MIILKTLLLLCFIFLSGCLSIGPDEKITKIDSFTEVAAELSTCDAHTVVTFDVDDTLIAAKDALANLDIPWWFKIQALMRYPQLIRQENFLWAASIMFDQAERFVIEPYVIEMINQLKKQSLF